MWFNVTLKQWLLIKQSTNVPEVSSWDFRLKFIPSKVSSGDWDDFSYSL